MQERGFLVDFPPEALREAAAAAEPAFEKLAARDLTGWLWSSIDNDDSRDLDQIEYAVKEAGGTRLYVAIAQVDYFVPKNSSLDAAAQHNTTSIYTGVQTFAMLPERLSTDLSSLAENQKRLAVVIEMLVDGEGKVANSAVYLATVVNKAQLAYDAVAAWLESGESGVSAAASDITKRMLDKIQSNSALQEQLRLQDAAAQALCRRRHEAGALTLQAIEFRPTVSSEGQMDLSTKRTNRATQLIEDLMIAANQAMVGYLLGRKFPTLRRVVRTPKRWDRIMELASQRGDSLPAVPDVEKLEGFLQRQKQRDPERFPDLSLAVIKLLGRGEYVINVPGQAAQGHFSLAVENYSHSTAPNRRYPDILTQRLALAALAGKSVPYALTDLQALALHCTEKEDDANKVERAVHKCIAAEALASRIGETFPGYITGASDKGVWVRILQPPVEGKLQGKLPRLDVGDRVLVRLAETNPERGYIDFELLKLG
jgi:exoribonuclease II